MGWAMRIGLVAALFGAAASAHAGTVDRIAATVNDDVIALSEVYELGGEFIEQRTTAAEGSATARREAEIEVLDSLILRRLISQEIERLDLDVTDVEVDRAIDDVATRNGLDRDGLQREVEGTGLAWTQYKDELRENLRQQKFQQAVIRPRITVNEDELQDAYKRNVVDAAPASIADVGAIFFTYDPALMADPVKAEAERANQLTKATAARARIVGGEDFSKVAAELDPDHYGKTGGRMGTFKPGELVDNLDKVVFGTPVGQPSEPVVLTQGVFILYVFGMHAEEPPAFEAVRDQLLDKVYSGRIADETDQWYRQARRRAAVEVKLAPITP